PDGSALVEGASGNVGFRGTFTARKQNDVATPGGELSNSGLNSSSGSGTIGTHGGWGSLSAHYSQRSERLELHEDPAEEPDATGFQRISTGRGALDASVHLGG